MPGNQEKPAQFFNQLNYRKALNQIGKLYPRPIGNSYYVIAAINQAHKEDSPPVFRELRNLYWGRDTVGKDTSQMHAVGLWGQIWAIGVVWSLVRRSTGPAIQSRKELAVHVFAYCKQAKVPMPSETELYGDESNVIKEMLSKRGTFLEAKLHKTRQLAFKAMLNTKRQEEIPPLKDAALYRNCFVHYVATHLLKCGSLGKLVPENAADCMIEALNEQEFNSVEACFDGLIRCLDLSEVIKEQDQAPLSLKEMSLDSWIEPDMMRYVFAKDDRNHAEDIKLTVGKTRTALERPLRQDDPPARTVALRGPANAGKKAVIGDFLRQLKTVDEEDLRYEINQSQANEASVPVFCIQTKNRDYLGLCIETLVFLERLAARRNRQPNEVMSKEVAKKWVLLEQEGGIPHLEPVFERIRKLHKDHPALFIFMDVTQGGIRALIRGGDIDRLVEQLSSSNKDSRFVFTTTKPLSFKNLSQIKHIEVPKPRLDRIKWYLNETDTKRFNRITDAGLFHFDLTDKLLSGDGLMALSVLFPRNSEDDTQFVKLVTAYCEAHSSKPTETEHEMARQIVMRALVCQWQEAGLLEVIAMIAASQDGLISEFITQSLTLWNSQENLKKITLDKATVFKKLERLAGRAQNLFLKQVGQLRLNIDEIGFDEPAPETEGTYYNTWEFSENTAAGIMAAISEIQGGSEILRTANRLVAIFARRRAINKLLRTGSESSLSKEPINARNIQAFDCLIRSLPPYKADLASPKQAKKKSSQSRKKPNKAMVLELAEHENVAETASAQDRVKLPLKLSATSVFTLSDDFDPQIALQYAANVMLRDELDQGFRLSMAADQDLIRLSLYLTLWRADNSVGRNENDIMRSEDIWWKPKDLKNVIPPHIAAAFSPDEQLDLLVTIVLAAFFCHRPSILQWAFDLADRLTNDTPDQLNSWSRILAAKMDMEILVGGQLSRARKKSAKNQLRKLAAKFHKQIEQRFKLFQQPDIVQKTRNGEVSPIAAEAFMRLRARQLTLIKMIGADTPDPAGWDTPDAIFKGIQELENAFVGTYPPVSPTFFSGRTARRLAQDVSGNFPIYTEIHGAGWCRPSKNKTLQLFEDLCRINTSKLVRYAGAERVAVLLDTTRLFLLRGKVEYALVASTEAMHRAMFGTVSHGSMIDLLSLDAMVRIAAAEIAVDVKGPRNQDQIAYYLTTAHENTNRLNRILDHLSYTGAKLSLHILDWRIMRAAKYLDQLPFSEHLPGSERDHANKRALDLAERIGAKQLRERLADLFSRTDILTHSDNPSANNGGKSVNDRQKQATLDDRNLKK